MKRFDLPRSLRRIDLGRAIAGGRLLATDDDVIRAILSVPTHYAELVVTAIQVLRVSGTVNKGVAAETITAGQCIFTDSANSDKVTLTDANAAGKKSLNGIALNGGAIGQQITYLSDGVITLGAGAAPAIGVPYFASKTTPGSICVAADLGTQDTILVGVGAGSNNIALNIWAPGYAIA